MTVAAEGGKADIAKPLKGLGSGVFEIALPYRSDAYRVIYAVQLDEAIWVVHAFQKKSTKGIKTPQKDIDLIKARHLKNLNEQVIDKLNLFKQSIMQQQARIRTASKASRAYLNNDSDPIKSAAL